MKGIFHMKRIFNILGFLALTQLLTLNQATAQSNNSPVRDPNRTFARPVLNWTEIRNQNIVMQERDYSCGAAALATVLKYYWGKDVSEENVLDSLARSLRPEALKDRTENGLTMADLKVVSDRMGYDAAVGKLDNLSKLTESKIPVIVTIKVGGINHFVVFRGTANGYVYLADPIRGNVRVSNSEFENAWVENAIFVITLPGKTSSAVSRLSIRRDEIMLASLNHQVIRRQVAPSTR